MIYITNIIKRTEQKHFVFLFGLCALFLVGALNIQAAQIERYTGGVLVYADDTVGIPKYKIFTDGTGFGVEQSASQVGSTTIEWVRVAASPTSNEWIIVTRDAADRIVAQVCVGINDGLSCGATTTISATAGTHGLRNFDVAYEQTSGHALLVYGTATADELRKIEYSGGAWVSDASITTTRTTGTIEWVELTSRNASDQIGVAYSDSNDDVSAYRWSGTAIGNEATAAITATAATTDVRKFDVSFEGVSGDMIVAAPVNGAGTTALGHMTSAGTWTIVANTEPDNITAFIDLQEPNPIDDEVAMVAHGTATTSNPAEGYALNGATPNTTTTGMVDGAVAVDTTSTVWAANYMMASVAYQSSTYYAVGVFSDVTGADDINWWTMASTSVWTAHADNTRTRGTIRFTDLFDYPNADKVLLLSSDANSDLWADTWNGAATSSTAWTDVTSGGALELTLSSATTDVYDFAFRISPPALSGVLYSDSGVTNAGSGKLIKLAVGTSSTPTIFSATTTAGGVWEFDLPVFVSATSGTPYVIWLDGDAEDANTLVSGYTGTSIASVPLYYNHVIVHGAATTSQVNASAFGFYDDTDDADIKYSFDPSFISVGGIILINRGEFIAPTLLLGDSNFINRGVFNANGGTVALHGGGTIDGILTGTSSFYALSISGESTYTLATTSASTTNLIIGTDSTFVTATATNISVASLYANEGTFTHSTGTLHIGTPFAGFLAAVDVTGNNSGGTGARNANGVLKHGNYLYVTTMGSATACAQTPSAIGCELQVYDISDPTVPTYIAGRDSGGSAAGTRAEAAATLAIKDTYLYVSKETSVDECNPTIGNAYGCELLIFDISNPASPTFVTAVDDDGSVYGDGINLFITLEIEGDYLYTTKYNNSVACSQTPGSAEGCELQVFDISSSTNPIYVAGRDVEATSNGNGYRTVWGSTIAGGYWFTAMSGGDTVCSQTPGDDAQSCELQIYDISTPTNPTYVAGMDASGVSDGDTGNVFYDVAVSGSTLYVASSGAEYDCDTNNYSCELHVYDITDPTNPIFRTGRDASGIFNDNEIGPFVNLHVEGSYLYAFKLGNATACSQVAGSAVGCEVQIYDISSTTNPIYVAGRDADGTLTGTDISSVNGSYVGGGFLFAAIASSSATCNSTSAGGCEILAFQTTAIMGGNMTGASAFKDVSVIGSGVIMDSENVGGVTTRNLTINSGQVIAPRGDLIVGGNYTNRASFDANGGTVVLSAPSGVASGTMTGVSAFNNVEVTGNVTFTSAASTTNFAVAASATATAPASTLSVTNGNFNNGGVFLNNSGNLIIQNGNNSDSFTFLSGRDSSGSAAGTNGTNINAFESSGNYLYVAKSGTNAACSQTAGSAGPCEMLVFNIENPSIPTLITSRDVDGSAGGGDYIFQEFLSLAISGNYLYAGKTGNGEACSQSAGSAVGCELQVYDISSPANPVYRAGRDASGNAAGATGDAFDGGGINSLTISGNYLFVGKDTDIVDGNVACSQSAGSAAGCEIMVFDISSSTNPVYVAGRDVSGSAAGTGSIDVQIVVAEGGRLYIGKDGEGTACSQTPGSAVGCEIMVFDISSSTNPVYVAGRDVNGFANGEGLNVVLGLTVSGDHLYVGQYGANNICRQSIDAVGCELQVYNISSSTNPVYVAGRDANGSADGTTYGHIRTLAVSGDFLIIGQGDTGEAAPCSQVAGSAEGCEIKIYDISVPSNPSYVAGRDGNGSSVSVADFDINDVHVTQDALFVGKSNNTTACSQTSGSAEGCELMVFSANAPGGFLGGTLTGTSALNDVFLSGTTAFVANATTTDLTIQSGSTTLPNALTVRGNYLAGAGDVFSGEDIYFHSDSAQSIQDTVGGLSLPSTTFIGSGTKTLVGGASTTNVSIKNSAPVISSGALFVAGAYTNAGTLTAQNEMTVVGSYVNTGTTTVAEDFVLSGNYTNTGLSQMSGEFTVDTNMVGYVAGRDVQGSAEGSSDANFQASVIDGNYLYMGRYDSYTTCSQTPGEAEGCELQVYDISDPDNPVYVAGRDASGSSSGNAGNEILSLAVSGDYLYVGIYGDYVNCSQTLGNAQGCELQVYDISSSTNPVYVAGRDLDGSATGGVVESSVRSLAVLGNYLYVGNREGSGAGSCSQTPGSAEYCELQVYDISDPDNPTYVAGRDIGGSAAGSVHDRIDTFAISGNYLYVGIPGNDVTCSQTPGSAEGCEIQVYDISDPDNPTYVAGRDGTGSASGGVGAIAVTSLDIAGDYLYVGKYSSPGACSQTPGSAHTCELQVYDISDPDNPVYVAGRDTNGAADGGVWQAVRTLTVTGNYLYVGVDTEEIPCSQTPGSASGCEIQVYDISDPDNPVYVAGRDINGSLDGNETGGMRTLAASSNYFYAGTDGQQSTCSQTPGSASGCELQVYQLRPTLSGNLVGSNGLYYLTIDGAGAIFTNNASTSGINLFGGTVTAPAVLSVEEVFNKGNNATFDANGGEVVLLGGEEMFFYGSTTFFDLTKNATAAATTTFGAGTLTTIEGEWNFTGASAANRHVIRSSTPGSQWFINSATNTISNLAVRDSNNVNVSTVVCDNGCLDNGNNVNWSFTAPEALEFYSTAPHHFYIGQATTTLGAITIEETSSPSITVANDILLHIDTAVTNFRFNQGTPVLSYGGTAAAKVSTGAYYFDEDATIRLDVLENFAPNDTLVINGVTVGSFNTISTVAGAFELHTDDNIDGAPAAVDAQPIRITGSLAVANHPEDQVENIFSFQNRNDETLFRFALTANSENATITDMVLTLSGIHNLETSDITDIRLYRDTDNDGVLDGGDILVDGSGVFTINGQYGAITFSQDFVASTTARYIIVVDTVTIESGASAIFGIMSNGITSLGSTSLYSPVLLITADTIQHFRTGGGAGGVSARIGGSGVPGAGVVTGGESGGGGETGEEEDGVNIAPDNDFFRPTTTGSPNNEWTNGNNALLSDGTFATAASGGLRQAFAGFNFGIPTGNTIQGIAVKLDASGSTAAGTIDVSISWDGGNSFTTVKASPTLSGTDIVYDIGGNSDLWGRTWTVSEFSSENFRLRVTGNPSSNTLRLDGLEVRVYHQTGGGNSGGGGGGGRS